MSAAEGPLVVGVDSSTQSTKALVVDAATGQVVASGQAPHTVASGARPRERPRAVVGRAVRGAAPVRRRGPRGRRGLDRRPAARPRHAGRRRAAGAPGAAVERRALRAAGAPADRGAGRPEGLGRAHRQRARRRPSPSRSGPGCAEHEPEAAARDRGRTAAPRLPHRAAHRPGHHRPRRRLRHRLVGVGDRGVRRGDPRARRARPRAAAPRASGRARRPGPYATAATCRFPRAPWSPPAPATTRPPRSASGCAPGTPVLSLGTSGTVYAVSTHRPADPTGTVAGLRRRPRRLAAAGLHAQLHARRRPGRRAARPGPRGRRARRLGRRCCPSWTASAPRTCRTPPGCCTGCATTRPAGSCSRPPTTAPCTRLLGALDLVLDADARPLARRCC